MRFFFFILIIIFFLSCSRKQYVSNDNSQIDSFKKYSYLIIAYKNGTDIVNTMGTGFFIKADTGYYFITAQHVITGINPFNLKREHDATDFITIFFRDSSGQANSYLDVPVGLIAKQMLVKKYYEQPDIVILHFVGLDKAAPFIHCIDINYSINDRMIERLFSWGYGVSNIDSLLKKKNVDAKDIRPMYFEGVLADASHIDPMDYANDTMNIHVQPETVNGMSGEPVFFQYKDKRIKDRSIQLGGVVFGGNLVYHSALIVSYKSLIQKILDYQFPKYLIRY